MLLCMLFVFLLRGLRNPAGFYQSLWQDADVPLSISGRRHGVTFLPCLSSLSIPMVTDMHRSPDEDASLDDVIVW